MVAPTIKIMAVENDANYAQSLSSIIGELGYELVGVAENAFAALKLVEETLPDLILMDPAINDAINGVELATRINANRRIPIVFVAAFKDQQTFQTARSPFPTAFIIKPYDRISLQSAIEVAIFLHPVPNATVIQPEAMGDTFYIKDNQRVVKIRLRDVVMVEADDYPCVIVTNYGQHTINMRLNDLLRRMPHEDFIQVHNSFAVRKSSIKAVNFADQTLRVAEREIPIGKGYREQVLSTLNLLS
jgi:DNA-binding LytR/AlgR family response regulator